MGVALTARVGGGNSGGGGGNSGGGVNSGCVVNL